MPRLNPDRLFPADPGVRRLARALHAEVAGLPIVSPHGHCDPGWFAEDAPFSDPAALLITPDHYLLRMLHSQGVALERLGVAPLDGGAYESDPRAIWRTFAVHYHLFWGTPSRIWMEWVLAEVFGVSSPRAVRELQHRGPGHHGGRARPPGAPRPDP
jgi:glucuronate isomerase